MNEIQIVQCIGNKTYVNLSPVLANKVQKLIESMEKNSNSKFKIEDNTEKKHGYTKINWLNK